MFDFTDEKEWLKIFGTDSAPFTREADVQKVRHGHWIQIDDTKCQCSACDVIAFIALYPSGADKNFCPNCGAKMDGGESNAEIH